MRLESVDIEKKKIGKELCGYQQEAIDKIFVPFYTTKRTGSGIGLSLSRQIMQMHNGSINVESEPDVKTIFTLRF